MKNHWLDLVVSALLAVGMLIVIVAAALAWLWFKA